MKTALLALSLVLVGCGDSNIIVGELDDAAVTTADLIDLPLCPSGAAGVMGARCNFGVDTRCRFVGYPYFADCLCNGWWETDLIFVYCDGGAPDMTSDGAIAMTPDATIDMTPDAAPDLNQNGCTKPGDCPGGACCVQWSSLNNKSSSQCAAQFACGFSEAFDTGRTRACTIDDDCIGLGSDDGHGSPRCCTLGGSGFAGRMCSRLCP